MIVPHVLLAAVVASLAATGCPAEPMECVVVDPACAPLYEPTFDNVYAMTLQPKCGDSDSCHAGASPRGDLDLSDPDTAYAALLAGDDPYVVPGDASCSDVTMRLATDLRQFKMPPGRDVLSAAEQCAVQQWIAAGAPR